MDRFGVEQSRKDIERSVALSLLFAWCVAMTALAVSKFWPD